MNLEKKTVEVMIDMYCKGNHYVKDSKDKTSKYRRCPICNDLREYAFHKIENCQFKENKPVCSKCVVKCYNDEHRELIKVVMRYAGPRMLGQHPLLLVRYVFRKKVKKV